MLVARRRPSRRLALRRARSGRLGHRFGYDARSAPVSADVDDHGAERADALRRRVQLDGTVDSSPIYGPRPDASSLPRHTVARGDRRDTGCCLALHAAGYAQSSPASTRSTNATPTGDDARRVAARSDGASAIASSATAGALDDERSRATTTTRSSLRRSTSRAASGSRRRRCIGDAPPYQGHVVHVSERRSMRTSGTRSPRSRGGCSSPTCLRSDSALLVRTARPAIPTRRPSATNAPGRRSTNWGEGAVAPLGRNRTRAAHSTIRRPSC